MTTVTTRLAIDVLRSARVRRETYVGEWLPEPLVEPEAPAAVEAEESVSLAMLVLLERLNPVERAVFVLRESFDVALRSRSPRSSTAREDNCRQILTRARRRVAEEQPALRRRPGRAPHARRPLPRRRPRGRPRGPRRRARPGRGPDRRRRRRRPLDPAPDARRRGRSPARSSRSTARSTRSASRSSPSGSTASRASARVDAEAASSTSSASTSSAAGSPSIYSILNPAKLAHLGETSDLGLRPQSSSAPALTFTVAAVIVPRLVGGHEGGDVADVVQRRRTRPSACCSSRLLTSCLAALEATPGSTPGDAAGAERDHADAAVLGGELAAHRLQRVERGLQAAEAGSRASGSPSPPKIEDHARRRDRAAAFQVRKFVRTAVTTGAR